MKQTPINTHSEHSFTSKAPQERLDKALAQHMSRNSSAGTSSRGLAQGLISAGQVRVNGALVTNKSRRLKPDDLVCYAMPPAQEQQQLACPLALEVHYEDAHLLVVYKPAGLLTHPVASHNTFENSLENSFAKGVRGDAQDSLVRRLRHHLTAEERAALPYEDRLRPGIVHRLDKDTSGLLIIAKTQQAFDHFKAAFAEHRVGRVYWAITEGVPQQDSGTIDQPLGRDPKNRLRRAVVAENCHADNKGYATDNPRAGKAALTHWRLLLQMGEFALLECRLKTGRTHQIRAHLRHIGLPLCGDRLYGGGRRVLPPSSYSQEQIAYYQGFARQALHAVSLEFTHPTSGVYLLFRRHAPPDFAGLIRCFAQTPKGIFLPPNIELWTG